MTPPTDTRPWGHYTVLFAAAGFQVKRIEVNPSARLSLQTHARRAETWIVTAGEGVATVGKNETPVKRGSVVQVAVKKTHRMKNTGKRPLVFIEVQMGDYLGEDDILRLEDDFNRANNH